MADYKSRLIADVADALVDRLDSEEIEIVSDEMSIALKAYEVTKPTTDIVSYDGYNEMLLKRYRACLIIAGRSPKTIAQYDRIVKKLFIAVQKNFTDMNVSDLRYFLAMEKSRGVSNRTLENTRIMISAFFTWMIDEELIIKNPCKPIKPIKYVDKIRLPYSAVEIDAMRSACVTLKERAIMETLLSTGVRVSELCSLKVNDIDFSKMTVTVLEGKGAKQRTTYINDVAKKHLLNYLNGRDNNGEYLFYNKWKEPLKAGGVRHILKAIEERAEITNVHPHRFRRTLATALSVRGMSVQEISKLLGHTNINTTMEYICVVNEQVQASYAKYATL